ncbi:MAG TPA: hypothetical protein DEO40_02750 [Treponema sp.]|nr:hypothetical protein [Treponema sp.]HBB43423.1 hypothetical protein [Treponema sp.]HCA19579.1 hypothetical protein [Treponema sp.]
MKKIFVLAALLLLAVSSVCAQSADRLTALIESEKVTYGQVCYFAAMARDMIDEKSSDEAAFRALVSAGYLPKKAEADSAVTLAQVAGVCSMAWDIKKSLFFKISKSPRYAFKQLQALGIISPSADPSSTVTGHQAVNIITACMELAEEEAAR